MGRDEIYFQPDADCYLGSCPMTCMAVTCGQCAATNSKLWNPFKDLPFIDIAFASLTMECSEGRGQTSHLGLGLTSECPRDYKMYWQLHFSYVARPM
jgi:hypothetical protein